MRYAVPMQSIHRWIGLIQLPEVVSFQDWLTDIEQDTVWYLL
jgi:hypothetical protein